MKTEEGSISKEGDLVGIHGEASISLWSEWEEQPIPALTPSIASPSGDRRGQCG